MTWDVENLFKPNTDYGPSTQADYEAKLQGLADMTNAQAPDALSLQEVGDPDALDDLEARLDGTWHRRVSQHFESRHPIRVAWLARPPITAHDELIDLPAELTPVRVDDQGTATSVMGRGAVADHRPDRQRHFGATRHHPPQVEAPELSERPAWGQDEVRAT